MFTDWAATEEQNIRLKSYTLENPPTWIKDSLEIAINH